MSARERAGEYQDILAAAQYELAGVDGFLGMAHQRLHGATALSDASVREAFDPASDISTACRYSRNTTPVLLASRHGRAPLVSRPRRCASTSRSARGRANGREIEVTLLP